MSHKSKLLKNTIIIAIGKLGTQIISYLLLPLFTTRMAVEEYGRYDLLCTLSLFICPVVTLLMEESMFRFLIDAKTERDKTKVISQTMIYSFFGILLFIPIAFIAMNIFSAYTFLFKLAFITFVISNVAMALANGLSRGLGKVKMYSFSNFILGIITLITMIIVLVWFPTAENLLWSNTISNIITALIVFGLLKVYKYVKKYDKQEMKRMIKYSIPLVPNSISWTIINMSDRIILTAIKGEHANGIYAMANRFPNIINVFYSYFYSAWKESAAKILQDKEKNKHYSSIYLDMKKILYSITLCLIAVMPFVFPLFIKEQYKDSYIYIPIIMVATYFANLSSFYGGIFSAYKDTKIMGTTTVVAAIINVVVDFALVFKFGVFAACISTFVADIVIYFYRKVKVRKYVKLRELNMTFPMILLTLVCLTYYINYIPNVNMAIYYIANAITLVISVAYSIFVNWSFMKGLYLTFINKTKDKMLKDTVKE